MNFIMNLSEKLHYCQDKQHVAKLSFFPLRQHLQVFIYTNGTLLPRICNPNGQSQQNLTEVSRMILMKVGVVRASVKVKRDKLVTPPRWKSIKCVFSFLAVVSKQYGCIQLQSSCHSLKQGYHRTSWEGRREWCLVGNLDKKKCSTNSDDDEFLFSKEMEKIQNTSSRKLCWFILTPSQTKANSGSLTYPVPCTTIAPQNIFKV